MKNIHILLHKRRTFAMNNQMTVLIADESADFGKACQRELKQVGFDVVAVKKDGRRVIDALETKHLTLCLWTFL